MIYTSCKRASERAIERRGGRSFLQCLLGRGTYFTIRISCVAWFLSTWYSYTAPISENCVLAARAEIHPPNKAKKDFKRSKIYREMLTTKFAISLSGRRQSPHSVVVHSILVHICKMIPVDGIQNLFITIRNFDIDTRKWHQISIRAYVNAEGQVGGHWSIRMIYRPVKANNFGVEYNLPSHIVWRPRSISGFRKFHFRSDYSETKIVPCFSFLYTNSKS